MPQIQVLPGAPGFGSQLGQALGQGFNQGISARLNQMLEQRKTATLEKDLVKRGYPLELASLAAQATTGGKTEVLKAVLDQFQRGGVSPSAMNELQGEAPESSEERHPSGEDIGLTPKEKIARQSERFKTQFPKYEEFQGKAKGYTQEGLRLDRLAELNESGKLPTGLGRLNVNLKSGELVAPFVATPETQEFVKTINDFLSGAKDTFGSRVTNFEVNRFLKRLPSLLNTKEGRDSVLHQMSILNELNKIESQGLLDVVEQAGGLRNIDLDRAQSFVKRQNKEKIKSLEEAYKAGVEGSETGKELTKDMAHDILKQAKGDKEKARKIARKRGFEF